ncbi:Adenosylhomocysteinase [Actinacidiphila bryophytorum]|uniref:Adenosylhomocysteinase n=1 Tax=Actinacidiphila bryophytorum TaxID=1436133 RepID=A0A9W4GXA3_9ACTN|nr:Adenosylhomocysteinase [Actinacidiphila bryophytorum]
MGRGQGRGAVGGPAAGRHRAHGRLGAGGGRRRPGGDGQRHRPALGGDRPLGPRRLSAAGERRGSGGRAAH